MKYMLLIYMTDDAMTDADREACYQDSAQLCHETPLSSRVHTHQGQPEHFQALQREHDLKQMVAFAL